MFNKLFKHRHRYRIIGARFYGKDDNIEVDIICPKCGKHGTVIVPHRYSERILNQAMKHKYLNIPCIVTSKKWDFE